MTALPESTMLAIAGDGPLRAELEALALRLGVAHRVRWLGRVPHDAVPTFLAALDVAIAPYPELASFAFSPLKLYEYLAAGVPVVASDVGQVRGVLADGVLGSLTTPGDARELADAIRAVTTDPAPARARAARARHLALEHHGWERRAAEIVRQAREAEVALAR
jgi:glycosyltransferase involved in cell wall biosynthesis